MPYRSLCASLFLMVYYRLSKPINRIQTEAVKSGRRLDNDRAFQAASDPGRSKMPSGNGRDTGNGPA